MDRIQLIKMGIVAALPLLKLLAARTQTTADDELVALLEAVLVAPTDKVDALLKSVPAPVAAAAKCPTP